MKEKLDQSKEKEREDRNDADEERVFEYGVDGRGGFGGWRLCHEVVWCAGGVDGDVCG